MTATSKRGMKPRNGNTAAMIEYIRSSKSGRRTDELAERVGIDPRAVAPLLHAYVQRGELVTCLVQRPGKRDCTLYRDGSGIALKDERGWKGQAFPLASERKVRGKSLTAADIAGTTPATDLQAPAGIPAGRAGASRPAPAGPVMHTARVAGSVGVITESGDLVADLSAADSAHDQPKVSNNIGSAGAASPLCGGPRRITPASTDRALKPAAEEAGAIRFEMDHRGVLTIDTDAARLVLPRDAVCDLASILAGTRPIWSART